MTNAHARVEKVSFFRVYATYWLTLATGGILGEIYPVINESTGEIDASKVRISTGYFKDLHKLATKVGISLEKVGHEAWIADAKIVDLLGERHCRPSGSRYVDVRCK